MSAIYSLLVITDTILNRVTLNWKRGKRTHVFLDEFHVVFENEQSGVFFNSAWRQFRKRGAYPPPSLRTWSTCWTPCRPTPSQGVPWFQERGLWQDNSYEPRPGDIIFFDWDDGGQDGSSDHVGIVEKVENGRIYTIEGNSGDSCRQNSYPVGYYEIYGYGTPAH